MKYGKLQILSVIPYYKKINLYDKVLIIFLWCNSVTNISERHLCDTDVFIISGTVLFNRFLSQ